jgi:hypothetical protein
VEFSREESDVISALVAKGMPPANATVATIMATRTAGRARPQLVDFVLTGYSGLEDRDVTMSAVQQLLASGWLTEDEGNGDPRCHASLNIFSLMEEYVGDPELIGRVAALRAAQSPQVDLIGPIYDDTVSLRFAAAIAGARSVIRLPLLAPNLEERARRGVRLQILLASPDVVADLRGESQRSRAEDSIAGWSSRTREWPHTDVRIMRDIADAVLAASSSFDEGRAFLVVYDIRRQRSQQSTVLDVSQPGCVPNLVEVYNRSFADAWRRARPVRGSRLIVWWLDRMTWQIALAASVVVASTSSNATVSNVAAGIACTALLTLSVRLRSAVARVVARLRAG